jgi:hypothetical protein
MRNLNSGANYSKACGLLRLFTASYASGGDPMHTGRSLSGAKRRLRDCARLGRLLGWESTACGNALEQLVLDSPLYASQQTEFIVLHHLDHTLWNPSAYRLRIDYPFNMECDAQPWMAHMISLCDGKATGREVLRTLIDNEELPKSLSAGEFARAAASLVSGGFIAVEAFRPPQAIKL